MKKSGSRKTQEPTKYGTVICVRVTDEELETISGLRASTRQSVSRIMKEAFTLYLAENGRTVLPRAGG